MTFTLDPEYPDDPRLQDLVGRLREYLDGELAEYEAELGLTPESAFTRERLEPVWKRRRELGFYGVHLPRRHGGLELTYTELAALKEEVGASGRALQHSVLGGMGGPLRAGPIFEHATEYQLEKYLLPVIRGGRACCFSLTETGAGSDVRAMRDLVLENCYVGPEQLPGELGAGLKIGLGRVTANRLLHCPTVLGQARRALRLTIGFARTRQASGGPLARLQSIQHKLADMATAYYAARGMTYDALAALDAGHPVRTEAFMCKLFVAESAFRIADEAVQIHGKAGMVRGSEVGWLFRRLRMFRVLTGSSEIQKNGIAKGLLASGA